MEYMTDIRNLPLLRYRHVSNKPGLATLSPRSFRAQMKWFSEQEGGSVLICIVTALFGKLPGMYWNVIILFSHF